MTNFPEPASKRRIRRIVRWGVSLAWATLIFNLSTSTFGATLSKWLLIQILGFFHLSVSPPTFETLHFLLRKTAHFTEYSIFSMLLYSSFAEDLHIGWKKRAALWSCLIAGAYSLTDEFHQMLVPGRGASLVDSGIDTAGALFGILVLYFSSRLTQEKSTVAEVQPEVMVEK